MGAVASNNIVTDGLLSCWDAANRRSYPGTGTTWTDLVNGNNGTLENMDTGGFDSKNGGVIEFDGTNESVDLGTLATSSSLQMTGGPLSMCTWMYENSAAGSNSYPYIISKGSTDGANGYSIIADFQGAIQVAANSQWCRTATGIYSDDGWIYVVGTIDTDGNMRAYVNGVYHANARNYTGTPPSAVVNMRIGARGDSSSYFGGSIAHVAIYNAVLTDAEILQNYNATKGRFGL